MQAFDAVLKRFGVTIAEAADLRQLKAYDIVMIADDSGSMRREDPGMPAKSNRWTELEKSLRLIVSLGTCFDHDGLDIYFLNRGAIKGIKDPDTDAASKAKLDKAFADPPARQTPLSKTLATVVSDRNAAVKANPALKDKPVLLMIFTDGAPDEGADVFGKNLEEVLSGYGESNEFGTSLKFRCQMMACTGNDEEIQWARDLDKKLKTMDFTDDYQMEKKEMMKSKEFSDFTMGDWCLKAMLGAVDPKWDIDKSKSQIVATGDKKQGGMAGLLKLLLILAILAGVYYVHNSVAQHKDEM